MSSCDDIRALVAEALDAGEPDAPESARLHLADCPRCRAWWQQTREMESLLGESAESVPSAPDSLHRRIRAAIQKEKMAAPSRSVFARFPGVAVAASLILVVGIVALLVSSRPGQVSRPSPPPTGPGPTPPALSFSGLQTVGDLISVVSPVEEARSEVTWLTQTLVSNARSAARVVAPDMEESATPRPSRTPA